MMDPSRPERPMLGKACVVAFLVAVIMFAGCSSLGADRNAPSNDIVTPASAPASFASASTPSTAPTADGTSCSVSPEDITRALGGPVSEMRLVAAFETTRAGVEAWILSTSQSGGLSGSLETQGPDASEPAAVCYFDGDFGPPHGPVSSDTPNYSRVIVAAEDGSVRPLAAGWPSSLPIVDPDQAIASPAQ